uniref:Methyltransferase HEMK2 n=1 Tax=Nothobranchius furzeri TaxID=105023 RepID=A0A8C6W045_NOTFU
MCSAFPTPLYSHVGRGDFRDVYEPAQDSFLLIDALEKDAERLPCVCLEVGSGSGVVSAFLASVVGPSAVYICTDVNPAAAGCTATTASCNSVSLQPVLTDLVRVHTHTHTHTGKSDADLLVFRQRVSSMQSRGIEASWAGGERGREVTDRFLPAAAQLLSQRGLFYLVTIAENHPEEIVELLGQRGLEGELCSSTRAGNERLSVLRFSRRQT